MEQLEIKLPDSRTSAVIYQLVNNEKYQDDSLKAYAGNNSAKKRLRKQLLEIEKLCKKGRKELLKKK